ncbi:MAG: DUF2330 domain-containing protein [Polyangiaceae bacterium]|nr:DUF2330 domain-containing protein [Polyangiaceae bacterium]
MRSLALGLLLALSALLPKPARACAPAYPPEAIVRVADESAIIIWDELAKVEHFIRRATFTSSASDFGFLVPTPSRPELAEAPDSVFASLEQQVRPPVHYRYKVRGIEPGLLCAAPFYLTARSAVDSAAPPVRVLETKRVAGYDAAVLQADSATALAEWLQSNGYASRPALSEWLAPYVAMRWTITAYKIAAGREANAVETSAVRMSFKTDKPFFPYREPADQRETITAGVNAAMDPPSRVLRVFFVGPRRVEGTVGTAGSPWPGETTWADSISSDLLKPAMTPLSLPFERAWLTAFEDRSNPRPGVDDVFFSASGADIPVKPLPVEVTRPRDIFVPLDLLALVIGGSIWFVHRVRKRRSGAAA